MAKLRWTLTQLWKGSWCKATHLSRMLNGIPGSAPKRCNFHVRVVQRGLQCHYITCNLGLFGANDLVSRLNISPGHILVYARHVVNVSGWCTLEGVKGDVDRPMDYPHGSYPSQSYGWPPDLSIQNCWSNDNLNVYKHDPSIKCSCSLHYTFSALRSSH